MGVHDSVGGVKAKCLDNGGVNFGMWHDLTQGVYNGVRMREGYSGTQIWGIEFSDDFL